MTHRDRDNEIVERLKKLSGPELYEAMFSACPEAVIASGEFTIEDEDGIW